MDKIRVVKIQGTPYEMGYQHGQLYRKEICEMAAERVHLCSDPQWTGRELSQAEVLALAEACIPAHQAYSPDLFEELEGMAAATDLSLSELIILNGFTDFVDTIYNSGKNVPVTKIPDNCTAFIVPDQASATGQGYYGQTWDMHATATPYVILLDCRPPNAPNSRIFTITGCVGMIGMNAAGIAVGINMLSGTDGQIGVTWPFVIRKILAQTNIEDALACLTSAKLAGAHNYLLFDKQGRGFNVEAMATAYKITELGSESLVHTNHCLFSNTQAVEKVRPADLQANSEARLSQATGLLAQHPVTTEDLMALTRNTDAICRISEPPYHVESCGAAIMRPATGDFWAVWGVPTKNEYEHFSL